MAVLLLFGGDKSGLLLGAGLLLDLISLCAGS